MKTIIIDRAHESKITELLDSVQSQSRVRTISAGDIISECDAQTIRLFGLGASLKALAGTEIHIDVNAQSFPHAYKYDPDSTHFIANFDGKKWTLTNVYRGGCGPSRGHIRLSDAAKHEIFRYIELHPGVNFKASRSNGRLYRY